MPRERVSGSVAWSRTVRSSAAKALTITFSVTDTLDKVPVTYTGILPDLFREGQGVVAEGSFKEEARFSLPIPCLPSMTKPTCPRIVRGPVEGAGRQSRRQGKYPMIIELGHYALVLALAIIAVAGSAADYRRIAQRSRHDGDRHGGGQGHIPADGSVIRCSHLRPCDIRLLRAERLGEFAFADPADLQVLRRLGQSRRLDAAVGADPDVFLGTGRGVRQQSAGDAESQCAGRPGLDRRCLSHCSFS